MQSLGSGPAFFAEFSAIMIAVEIAYSRGWRKVWIEMDSELTLKTFFNKDYKAPWKIRKRWLACHSLLASMKVKYSHIYH